MLDARERNDSSKYAISLSKWTSGSFLTSWISCEAFPVADPRLRILIFIMFIITDYVLRTTRNSVSVKCPFLVCFQISKYLRLVVLIGSCLTLKESREKKGTLLCLTLTYKLLPRKERRGEEIRWDEVAIKEVVGFWGKSRRTNVVFVHGKVTGPVPPDDLRDRKVRKH